MANKEINMGLLSTAKNVDLVTQTVMAMDINPITTDVIAITTASNKDGRRNNTFAENAFTALSKSGFTNIIDFDVEGKENDEIKEQLLPVLPTENKRLLVITGGDTYFLRDQLRRSGTDRLITEGLTNAQFSILTISAGTTTMGTDIEVTRKDPLRRPSGIGIVPSMIVCDFDWKKEEKMLREIKEAHQGPNKIIGISDRQALLGKSGSAFSVIGEGFATVLERTSTSDRYQRRLTKTTV